MGCEFLISWFVFPSHIPLFPLERSSNWEPATGGWSVWVAALISDSLPPLTSTSPSPWMPQHSNPWYRPKRGFVVKFRLSKTWTHHNPSEIRLAAPTWQETTSTSKIHTVLRHNGSSQQLTYVLNSNNLNTRFPYPLCMFKYYGLLKFQDTYTFLPPLPHRKPIQIQVSAALEYIYL